MSLDGLKDWEMNAFVGITFDPTFEAVALTEEWENVDGVFSAAQMVDWDSFAIVVAAMTERRNAEYRKESAKQRDGRPKKKGGLPRVPDMQCPICDATFRPATNEAGVLLASMRPRSPDKKQQDRPAHRPPSGPYWPDSPGVAPACEARMDGAKNHRHAIRSKSVASLT